MVISDIEFQITPTSILSQVMKIKDQQNILFDFIDPPAVENVMAFRLNNSCINITYTPLDFGKCSAVIR